MSRIFRHAFFGLLSNIFVSPGLILKQWFLTRGASIHFQRPAQMLTRSTTRNVFEGENIPSNLLVHGGLRQRTITYGRRKRKGQEPPFSSVHTGWFHLTIIAAAQHCNYYVQQFLLASRHSCAHRPLTTITNSR